MALEIVLGSKSAEQVLIYIYTREEGYAREIARFFEADFNGIYKQLEKFESGGVLASKKMGKTRMYRFNPRYPFLKELKSLLEKAVIFYPEDKQESLLINRRRPRGKGKSL